MDESQMQIKEDETFIDRDSSCQNFVENRQKCKNILGEFDNFSIPVQLNVNGQYQYKTKLGGAISIFITLSLILITYLRELNGVQLNSKIISNQYPKNSRNPGENIFDYDEQPFWFNIKPLRKQIPFLKSHLKVQAYEKRNGSDPLNLQISSNCNRGDYCLKKSEINKNLDIFGSFYEPQEQMSFLRFFLKWCNSNNNPNCSLSSNDFQFSLGYAFYRKQKGGSLTIYNKNFTIKLDGQLLRLNTTQQQFTSNNKIMGHLSNILPTTKYFHNVNPSGRYFNDFQLSLLPLSARNYCTIVITSSGIIIISLQQFEDIASILLFFWSIRQTLCLLALLLIIRPYSRNSGYLEIGQNLFYEINDDKQDVYNLNGFDSFFACLIYQSFFFRIFRWLYQKSNKDLNLCLSKKMLMTIGLINAAKIMLEDKTFYENLTNIDSVQDIPNKLIPLSNKEQEQKQEYQKEQNQLQNYQYFPNDQIKKKAFEQFCQCNDYYKKECKNYIYKLLQNKKIKQIPQEIIYKQFQKFIRLINCRIHEGNIQILHQNQIHVQLNHDSKISASPPEFSGFQLMTPSSTI